MEWLRDPGTLEPVFQHMWLWQRGKFVLGTWGIYDRNIC